MHLPSRMHPSFWMHLHLWYICYLGCIYYLGSTWLFEMYLLSQIYSSFEALLFQSIHYLKYISSQTYLLSTQYTHYSEIFVFAMHLLSGMNLLFQMHLLSQIHKLFSMNDNLCIWDKAIKMSAYKISKTSTFLSWTNKRTGWWRQADLVMHYSGALMTRNTFVIPDNKCILYSGCIINYECSRIRDVIGITDHRVNDDEFISMDNN